MPNSATCGLPRGSWQDKWAFGLIHRGFSCISWVCCRVHLLVPFADLESSGCRDSLLHTNGVCVWSQVINGVNVLGDI